MKPGTLGPALVGVLLTALVAFGADNEEVAKLCGQGVELLNKGKPKQALAVFDEVLQKDYQHRDAMYNRALALYELKDYQGAEQAFKDLLVYDPGDMNAQSLLGSIELQSGFTEQAKQRFIKVLEQYPEDVTTMINLGLAEFTLGNRFAGEDYLKRALKLKPTDSKLETLVYNIQQQNREFTEAQEAEKRRQILAKFNEAVYTLGTEWTRQYEEARARGEYELPDREAGGYAPPAPYYKPHRYVIMGRHLLYHPSTGRWR